jgi:hypothetical protein
MSAQPNRPYASDPREPTLHELPPLRIADQVITVQATVRWSAGAWRGRLRFTAPEGLERETAEIFYGPTQEELWRSVASIGTYHLRALFQSLS